MLFSIDIFEQKFVVVVVVVVVCPATGMGGGVQIMRW